MYHFVLVVRTFKFYFYLYSIVYNADVPQITMGFRSGKANVNGKYLSQKIWKTA